MLTAIAVAVLALAVVFGVLFGLPVVLDRYFGGGGYAPTKRRRGHRRRRAPTEDLGHAAPASSTSAESPPRDMAEG